MFQSTGWPTPSNWTEASAREHCERELEKVVQLRYCNKAVLTANGTYFYTDIINMCVQDIRVCVLPVCEFGCRNLGDIAQWWEVNICALK